MTILFVQLQVQRHRLRIIFIGHTGDETVAAENTYETKCHHRIIQRSQSSRSPDVLNLPENLVILNQLLKAMNFLQLLVDTLQHFAVLVHLTRESYVVPVDLSVLDFNATVHSPTMCQSALDSRLFAIVFQQHLITIKTNMKLKY